MADTRHKLTFERRQEMLERQGGRCQCGLVFDVHGGNGSTGYEIDHDHGCCPGKFSCGKCIRALVCHSCNIVDHNNPDRAGKKGSASKYRGVEWDKPTRKWRAQIRRGRKAFSPAVIGLPSRYADEDEAGVVAQKLADFLDTNTHLWRANRAGSGPGDTPKQGGIDQP